MPPIDEFCHYNKHQYYNAQGGICKLCDRCPIGWGLASFQDSKFEIDPQHGARGCQHCVQCKQGFYSKHFSYEECQPCKECLKEGRFETRPCSSTRNAVCGSSKEPTKFERSHQPSDNLPYMKLAIALSSLVALAVFVAVVVCLYLKKRRSRKRKEERKANKGDITNALISTSTISTSTTSKSIESCDLATDGDSIEDSRTAIEQWKLEHDGEKELAYTHARMISKYITKKNIFHDIGLQLGVQEIDIQIILADKHGVEEQAYATLTKWKQLKASDATVFNFLDVLLRLDLDDTAKIFCDKYDVGSNL